MVSAIVTQKNGWILFFLDFLFLTLYSSTSYIYCISLDLEPISKGETSLQLHDASSRSRSSRPFFCICFPLSLLLHSSTILPTIFIQVANFFLFSLTIVFGEFKGSDCLLLLLFCCCSWVIISFGNTIHNWLLHSLSSDNWNSVMQITVKFSKEYITTQCNTFSICHLFWQ